ncbi:MAG: hypothetical protein EP319_13570 [Deltaproteobacteria bacterium]|nr:MAG: hypothetical protein EP319_13570 [Deltaproteobacteria bacterium]
MNLILSFLMITFAQAQNSYQDNIMIIQNTQTVLGKPYHMKMPESASSNCAQEIKENPKEDTELNAGLEQKLKDFEERVKNCSDNPTFASKYKEEYEKMYTHFKRQDKLFHRYISEYLPAKMNTQVTSHIGHHWNNLMGASQTVHTFRVNGQALDDIPRHKVEKLIGNVKVKVLPCDFKPEDLKRAHDDLDKLVPFMDRYWEYGACNKQLYEVVSNKTMPNGQFLLMGTDGTRFELAYDNLMEVQPDQAKTVAKGYYNPPDLPKLFISRQQLEQFNEKNAKISRDEKTIWEIVSETYFNVFYPQLIETEVPD